MNARPLIFSVACLMCCSVVVNAQPVPAGYRQVAMEFGLPPAFLYAVALSESGESSLGKGPFRPWPWTLNISGKGHYFPSRREAWQTLQGALENTNGWVDIGLMQISWRYHSAALGSAWHALDPYHNLRVAAAILRDCYIKHTNWMQSAGCYHAPNNFASAQAYASRVNQHWEKLADIEQEASFEHP